MGEKDMSNGTQKTNETKEPQVSEDSGGSQPKSVGLIGSALTAAFLIVTSIILVISLVQCWPSEEISKNASIASPARFLIWDLEIIYEARIILIVVLTGALGGQVRSFRSLVWHTGKRKLMRSWVFQYILSPFMGATLATITYFVIRGGFVSASSADGPPSVYVYAGIASIVGIASEPVALKLKQVAESLFTKQQEVNDTGSKQ
jgi:hypothetical protein